MDAVPAVLGAWVQFALRRNGLATEHIGPVIDTVAHNRNEFHALSADAGHGGPAKELLTGILADGVDLDDREGVDRVIGAYNAEHNAQRLFEQ